MQILFFSKEEKNHMWQWQKFHIFDELYRHNCYFKILDPEDFSTWNNANEALIREVKKKHYDLVITPYGDGLIYPDTIVEIKKRGIPIVLFCPDNNTIPFHYKNTCQYFDLVWLTTSETEYLFKKWGARTIFMPFAANPYLVTPQYGDEIEKVCFIGTPHGTRPKMLNTLLDGGIKTCLYFNQQRNDSQIKISSSTGVNTILQGAGTLDYFKFRIGRKIIFAKIISKIFYNVPLKTGNSNLELCDSLPFEELYKTYTRYALSISSVTARNTGVLANPSFFIFLRNFEIPMSGGLQICQYCEELAGYFEDGKEIIFYHSDEDLVEKAEFYLRPKNHKMRLIMKVAARKRAENEHTWFHRFSKIFSLLNIENI